MNGKKICEYVPTTKLPLLNTKRACLGKSLIPSIEYDCIGYIDEFRISNVARWTDNFTPGMPEVSKALLVITMTDGERKEYELSKTEVDAFISWYATKDAGSGNPYYTFNKQFNLGPFQSRTDYLAFDKIQDFEVKVF